MEITLKNRGDAAEGRRNVTIATTTRSAGYFETLSAGFPLAAATHLHLSGMPLRRLKAILRHSSQEGTQLYVLEDEARINGTHSPFDLLDGVE